MKYKFLSFTYPLYVLYWTHMDLHIQQNLSDIAEITEATWELL
jgi:hypothetical protein